MFVPKFAELVGILLGDGHLSKYKFQIVITLNSDLEKEYVTFIYALLKDLFKIEPKIRFFRNKKAIQIGLNSKIIFNLLNRDVGIPSCRRKTKPNNKIPDYIFNNKKLLKACIRGLFDTEGSLSIRHHKAIRLSIFNNSPFLLKSIYVGLKNLGFNAILKTRSVRLNRTSEIIRFFKEIGSNNPYKKKRYELWYKTGKLDNVHTVVL